MSADDPELLDLVAEGRAALAAPPLARVAEALSVLPRLVDALDRVSLYQVELRDVRGQLTVAVRAFREAVWKAQREHPEETFSNGDVHRELLNVTGLLDRLDRLIHSEAQ